MFWARKKNKQLNQSIVKYQTGTRRAKVVNPPVSNRLGEVVMLLQDQPEWDFAIDQKSARDNAVFGAAYMGYFAPFDPEQQALISFLTTHFAGRKIATFAWGIYAEKLKNGALQSA